MNYIGESASLGIKVEATAGTAVKPDTFIPLVSESIKNVFNYSPDRRMKGLNWKSDDLLVGPRKHEGDLVILADPDNLGHFLNMVMTKGTTTGGATGYTHPFTVGNSKSYTIEIVKGPYAQRYVGVKGDQLKIDFTDEKMQATLSIKAMGQFSTGKLQAALSGSVTSLKLAKDTDNAPNYGLVTGDVICVQLDSGSYQDITLTSVNADGETVGFGSLSITAAAGNMIYLKAQTPSYANLSNPFYQGETLVGIAATSALADTAASAKTTATPIYDFSLVIKTNLYDAPATGSRSPIQLLAQTKEAQLTLSRVLENVGQQVAWTNLVKEALTSISYGATITGGSTKEQLTVKLHKIKLTNNEEPIEAGSIIFDKQTFEALYDTSDAYAIEV